MSKRDKVSPKVAEAVDSYRRGFAAAYEQILAVYDDGGDAAVLAHVKRAKDSYHGR